MLKDLKIKKLHQKFFHLLFLKTCVGMVTELMCKLSPDLSEAVRELKAFEAQKLKDPGMCLHVVLFRC